MGAGGSVCGLALYVCCSNISTVARGMNHTRSIFVILFVSSPSSEALWQQPHAASRPAVSIAWAAPALPPSLGAER